MKNLLVVVASVLAMMSMSGCVTTATKSTPEFQLSKYETVGVSASGTDKWSQQVVSTTLRSLSSANPTTRFFRVDPDFLRSAPEDSYPDTLLKIDANVTAMQDRRDRQVGGIHRDVRGSAYVQVLDPRTGAIDYNRNVEKTFVTTSTLYSSRQ
jgi:hypothetical protein